jgi:hypothetical protein
MKHCSITIICNELPFLEKKVPFLYKNFDQLIFVDYNIATKGNSTDGSIEYLLHYPDPENKMTIIHDPQLHEIFKYFGTSFVEKQKMFARASEFIDDDIDVIWAMDADEFFDEGLIRIVEQTFKDFPKIQTIQTLEWTFFLNEHNVLNINPCALCKPRITRHIPGKIYGHCNFDQYTPLITVPYALYHFAYTGLERCREKLKLYGYSKEWMKVLEKAVRKGERYISVRHPNSNVDAYTVPFNGLLPSYLQ